MTYIQTPAEARAQGDVAQLYEADRADFGYVPNYTKVFALRPDVTKRGGS